MFPKTIILIFLISLFPWKLMATKGALHDLRVKGADSDQHQLAGFSP
jgi:hypothetical protein